MRCQHVGQSLRFLFPFFAVLGLAVIVVSLPDMPSGAQKSGAAVAAELEPPQSPAERALQEELDRLAADLQGEVGLAVSEVNGEASFHANGDTLFPQQSVSKLWVAMAALALADEGDLDLTEAVTIRREDLTVFHQPIRNIVRTRGYFSSDYGDLLDRAITQSDNAANDRLLRRVGGADAVQDFLDDKGLGAIRFGTDERTKQSAIAGLEWRQTYSYRSRFFDARDAVPPAQRRAAFEAYLADPVDGASPLVVAIALSRLARGELLSSPSTELLLSTLERTRSGPNRLKAGLPEGWSIAHKTGTGQFYDGEQSAYNDVGIVTAPDGRSYAVVAMIRRTRAPIGERMAMMQALVGAVARYHTATGGAVATGVGAGQGE